MLAKTVKCLRFVIVALGTAATGTVAPGVGFVTGLAATYLAAPQPAQCDGSCAPAASYICGLNGRNYENKMYIGTN